MASRHLRRSNPRELAKVPRDLIKFRGVALRGLRYSPDGKRIRFNSLIKINRDGSNPRELAKVPRDLIKFRGVALRGLRYSPDGKRIRFNIGGWPSDTSSLW